MDDMVRGYLDGLNHVAAELPEWRERESAAYKHGWNNGRDDRIGRPRETANVLRRRAGMILGLEVA